jgi:hypothetical protein
VLNIAKSKYEVMVGKIVNEVLVSNYRRVEKVSKTTGKRYYKYEVELENILWVSTQSFNRGSFKKRLAKLMANKETKQEQPKSTETVKEDNKYTKYWNYKMQGLSRDDIIDRYGIEEYIEYKEIANEIEFMGSSAFFGKELCWSILESVNSFLENPYGSIDDLMDVVTFCQDAKGFFELKCRATNKTIQDGLDKAQDDMKKAQDELDKAQGDIDKEVRGKLNKSSAVNDYVRYYSYKMEWELTDIQEQLLAIIESKWEAFMEQVFKRFFNEEPYVSPESQVNEYDEQFQDLDAKACKRLMRNLSKTLHPDHGGDEADFKKMYQAYERQMARVA